MCDAARMMGQHVSVLLPVYMAEPTTQAQTLLDRAIASVMAQEFAGRLELIIIDDGCPTPVAELIEPVTAPGRHTMRILRNDANQGIVGALNRGLGEARHEIIGRIDADDAWTVEKTTLQLAQFRADGDVTIVGGEMMFMFQDDQSPERCFFWNEGWHSALKFTAEHGNPLAHGSVLARRDVFQLLGGYSSDPRYAYVEDYALWSLWLRFFKPAMVNQPVYAYTVMETSISGQNSDQQQRGARLIKNAAQSLSVAETVPEAMATLADVLGVSVLQAGVLCYRLWRDRPLFACPPLAQKHIEAVMPDRRLQRPVLSALRIPVTIGELLQGFDGDLPNLSKIECNTLKVL
jgi:hypothetical protein